MRDVLIPACIRILRRLRSEERGQSLILVTIAMAIGLGFCAVGIDTASWYQKSHQMQVVADSAALAAANCLASPNVGPTGDICTSSTDFSDAKQVAVNYAAMNGVQISTGNVTISGNTVKVATAATSPSFFAQIFGIKTTTQSSASTAAWSASTSTTCTTADQTAGECYAVYAANQSCGSSAGYVVNSSGATITGLVHSQGQINFGSGGGTYTFEDPVTYSSGNCAVTWSASQSMPKDSPTSGGNEPAGFWPINYATVFPACTTTCVTTAAAANNGNLLAGTPSYCTYATTSSNGFTFGWITSADQVPLSGNIYCSIGSGTPSNPATWNGPITFGSATVGSASSPVTATFIGGSVSATGSTLYLAPAANTSNCLIYAVDADSAASAGDAIEFGNGNGSFSGTMFAPNGTVNLNSTDATTAFLEALNVNAGNLTFTGNGPLASSSSSSSSGGTDYLTPQ
jgi:hypothetical protein